MKPPDFFRKNLVILEISICDLVMVKSVLGVDPTQSYVKNTNSRFS